MNSYTKVFRQAILDMSRRLMKTLSQRIRAPFKSCLSEIFQYGYGLKCKKYDVRLQFLLNLGASVPAICLSKL